MRTRGFFVGGAIILGAAFLYFGGSFFPLTYDHASTLFTTDAEEGKEEETPKAATHLKTPEPVKGIYMTACAAATPSFRAKLEKLVEETELNTIIIDLKDYSGTISFETTHPLLRDSEGTGCRIADLALFIETLHQKNIYVVGRVTVFQDPYYAKKHPELAVLRKSDGAVWKDRKGLSFIDVSAQPYWDYIAAISEEGYRIGIDEMNFDYIRFPSDGDMKDIAFPHSAALLTRDPEGGKTEALRVFFSYLYERLSPQGIVLSADLFGMTTTNTDDLNIGQVLESAAPYFDYIAPMVYPSHYPPNFNGWKDPNKVPYEIVNFSMSEAARRLVAASSTSAKLRPWLQDNDYPVPYTPAMVRAQMQATYDSGLTSWMLWDAANTYTREALNKE